MAVIYLLRHGETLWNREEIFRGRADIPLNEFGRRQAKELANVLEKVNLQDPVFITSPLSRARETAEIAAAFNKTLGIIDNSAFIDICFGDWEGKALAEIKTGYPDLYRTWVEHPEKIVFPGGENLESAANRSEKGIREIIDANPNGNFIIVSHRAVNKALLCRLLGMGMEGFWKLRQDTACLNEIHFSKTTFTLVRLNDTCHLEAPGKDIKDS